MLRRTKLIIAGYCVAGLVLLALAVAMILQFTHWARHPGEFGEHHHHHEELEKPEAVPAKTYTLNGKTYLTSPFLETEFDVTQSSVDLAQIFRVNLNTRSFAVLEELDFVSADEIGLGERDGVLGVSIGGEEKAYPLRMLNYHIALNDLCGGREIAVVWDPLTMTPKVFDRKLVRKDGSQLVLSFANLGLVHKGCLLLYDKQTNSIWWPPEGKCIAGSLNGTVLGHYPFLFVSWAVWKERHPDTRVLSLNTAFTFRYSRNPYETYYPLPELPLPVEGWTPGESPFKWSQPVIALEADGQAKAYPLFVLLASQRDIEDSFGGKKIVIHNGTPPYPTDEHGREIRYSFGAWFLWSVRYPDIEVYQPDGEEEGEV